MLQRLRFLFLISLNIHISHSQNTVGTIINTTSASDGYTLFEFMGDTSIYLIDNCGQVINQWHSNRS